MLLGGLAAALLLGLPSLASATSVIYIDGGNVWTARVDGTQKAQFTTYGATTEPAWSDPSANGA